MANVTINQFPSGSISDSSLGVIGDPSTGALSKTTYLGIKNYITTGLTGSDGNINTSSLVTTSSFNSFTQSYQNDSSSFNNRINNITGSARISGSSNYIPIIEGNVLVNSIISQSNNNLIISSGSLSISNNSVAIEYPFIPTSTITSFGDSITVGLNATGNEGYIELLAAYYTQSLVNLAESGRGVWVMASASLQQLQANTTFVTAMAGFNDYRRSGVNAQTNNKLIGSYTTLLVAQYANQYTNGMNASVSWSVTPGPYAATTVGGKYGTGTGTYPNNTSCGYIGGGGAYSASWSFTGTNVAVGFIGNSGNIETFGTAQIDIDGVFKQSLNINNLWDNISDSVYDNRRGPYAITFFGLSTGSHTITVRTSGSGFVPLDYFATLRPTSSLATLLYEIPYMDSLGYATSPSSASSPIFASASLLVKGIQQQWASEGYLVGYVPTNNYYNLTNGTSSDNIHPGDIGHAQIESGSIVTINSYTSSVVTNFTTLKSFGNVSIDGGIYDIINSTGSLGQLLSSTGQGILWTNAGAGNGTVVGTGSVGAIALFSSSNGIGNSYIAQSPGYISIATSSFDIVNTRLGIGTNSPNTVLHLAGNAPSMTMIAQNGLNLNAGYLNAFTDFAQFAINRDPGTGLFFNLNKSAAQISLYSVSGSSSIIFYTSPINASVTQVGVIDRNGNFGIGITSPSASLEITGSSTIRASVNVHSGSTPSSPRDGDIWYDNSGSLNMNKLGNTNQFVFSNMTSSILPLSSSLYGVIYSSSAWANYNDFTSSSLLKTSLSGSKLIISGGVNSLNETLGINGPSCLSNWSMTVRVLVLSTGSTDYGFAIGTNSVNTTVPISVFAATSFTPSTGSTGRISLNGVTSTGISLMSTSSQALNVGIGNYLVMTLERRYDSMLCYLRNDTSGSIPVSASFGFDQSTSISDISAPNTGLFTIYSLGGTFLIDSIQVYSDEVKNADIMLIGDSKTVGYYSGQGFGNSFASQLGRKYSVVVHAGGGDTTNQVTASLNEILKLNPKQAVMLIGSNDPRYGVSSASFEANYTLVADALISGGTQVLYALPMYETSEDLTWQKTWIQNTFPSQSIIDTWTPMMYSGSIYTDGIHPSPYGHYLIYEAFLNNNLLRNPSNRTDYLNSNYIQNQNLVIQNAGFNVNGISYIQNSLQVGRPGFSGNVAFRVKGDVNFNAEIYSFSSKLYNQGINDARNNGCDYTIAGNPLRLSFGGASINNDGLTLTSGANSKSLVGVGYNTSPTAFLDITGSYANNASFRIRAGSPPTSPNDGDIWYDSSVLHFNSGSTVTTLLGAYPSSAPTNIATPVAWVGLNFSGSVYKLPLYQ